MGVLSQLAGVKLEKEPSRAGTRGARVSYGHELWQTEAAV